MFLDSWAALEALITWRIMQQTLQKGHVGFLWTRRHVGTECYERNDELKDTDQYHNEERKNT